MQTFQIILDQAPSRKTYLISGVLLGLVVLSSLGTLIVYPNTVYAASKKEIIAIIAIDASQKLGCQIEKAANESYSCPAGTIIQTRRVPLSQAKILRVPYIILPQQQTYTAWKIIYSMMRKKSHDLLSPSKMAHGTVFPHYSCGPRSSPSINWSNGFGANYNSKVDYYMGGSNCNQVYLEKAYMREYGDSSAGYGYWGYDLYAGTQYTVPGCPYLTSGSYSHDIDTYNSADYFYETWLFLYGCNGDASYVNLGPLT